MLSQFLGKYRGRHVYIFLANCHYIVRKAELVSVDFLCPQHPYLGVVLELVLFHVFDDPVERRFLHQSSHNLCFYGHSLPSNRWTICITLSTSSSMSKVPVSMSITSQACSAIRFATGGSKCSTLRMQLHNHTTMMSCFMGYVSADLSSPLSDNSALASKSPNKVVKCSLSGSVIFVFMLQFWFG